MNDNEEADDGVHETALSTITSTCQGIQELNLSSVV